MRKIYSLLLVALLAIVTFSCSKDKTEPTPEPTPTPTPTPTVTVEKKATANVTATGTSLENVIIMVSTRLSSNASLVIEKKDLVGGKASFDVKKYIGEELTFKAMDKATDEIISEEVKKTITEGDNAIALTVTKKDYTAKITVTENGNAKAGVTVYASPSSELSLLLTIGSRSYNSMVNMVENLKVKAETNTSGIATFENLKPLISSQAEYTFIVVTQTAPYYKAVKLTMDGTAKAGAIALTGSGSTGGGTTTPAGKASVDFLLLGKYGEAIFGASIEFNGVVKIAEYGLVTFNGLPENTTISYTVTTKNCKQKITGTHTTGAANTTTMVDLTADPEQAQITLNNTSSNPYTVTIGSDSWVIAGKSSRTFTGQLNTTYNIKWKQNSGYLLYPTEGNKNVSASCGNKNVTVSFP